MLSESRLDLRSVVVKLPPTEQWRKLLSHSKLKLENSTSDVSCLDIGAGCGDLTVEFMNVFKANNVTATEVSKM